MNGTTIPFHSGELEAQRRAGAGDVASWATGFIRSFMPEQHREFYTALPFLVVSTGDEEGRVWTTILEGPPGFVASPDPRTLNLAMQPDLLDPIAATLRSGTDIGVLGIEPATRRRNRLSGSTRPEGDGIAIDVRQTFGNCPQYIREREWRRVERTEPATVKTAKELSADQVARIEAADTLFIGTGHRAEEDAASNGYDASHRGGEPGFVQVVDANRLRIPDYAGNNFFNTIGNLVADSRVGLLFVDFATGGLLQVTGRAEVDWTASGADDPAVRRIIDVTVEAVVERPAALSLRWERDDSAVRRLAITRKVVEAEGVASFYLAPVDDQPLAPFEAGQHLPIELNVPGKAAKVRRTYSLSGAPTGETYRLTVKREPEGVASRFLHDGVDVGDVIETRRPSGDFVVSCGQCPLVFVSAGVGLTPMLAMLHTIAMEAGSRRAWFVHGTRDGAHHALREEVDRLLGTRPNFGKRVLYSRPRAEDRLGQDYDAEGRVTAEMLLALDAGPDAHYMLCGPPAFLADIRSGLEAAGVPAENVEFETFGPTG